MPRTPLREQVLVITGATSGIGLATARLAAEKGARLVLAARNEEALHDIANELESDRVEVDVVVADVGREADVERIAERALARFGRFDTWVNNAGVSIYGRLEEVSLKDHRRLFDTNYWGVVHGSLAALELLRTHGGTIINIGSALSARSIPLQGAYCASKHAVKGFTDALRMEVEEAELPVRITLLMPAAINTPYARHAKNYLDVEPRNPSPVYAPEVVAETILHCAEHPERDVFVGAAARMMAAGEQFAPRLTDLLMERTMFRQQRTDRPARPREDHALFEPGRDGRVHGEQDRPVFQHSAYTSMSLHPLATAAVCAGLGLIAAGVWRAIENNRDRIDRDRRDRDRDHDRNVAPIPRERAPVVRSAPLGTPRAAGPGHEGLPRL